MIVKRIILSRKIKPLLTRTKTGNVIQTKYCAKNGIVVIRYLFQYPVCLTKLWTNKLTLLLLIGTINVEIFVFRC